MSDDKLIAEDMAWLMNQPQFRRFGWRVIQMSGLFYGATTDGSEGRYLLAEGRRQLGLEILAECEKGHPVQHPDGVPLLTTIQLLREEAQQQPKEPKHAKRYSRTDEIAETDPD